MLDTDTKRRIDTARDILVGKVPDPKSQVEQITIALIYKFMDDMDAEAEELGGKRKFFAGDFARYGWAKLMRSGLGGHEILNLYAEAIAKMPETLLDKIHTAFGVFDTFELYTGEPRTFPWAKNVIQFPSGYKTEVKSAEMQQTGVAAAAKTDGRAGDGVLTIEEWKAGEKVVLPNHEVFQLAAGTLDPVAGVGDLIIVSNYAQIKPRDLVVAVSGSALLARRLNRPENHSEIFVLTGQTVDPSTLPPPVIVQPDTNFRKIVGTLFAAHLLPVPPIDADREFIALPNPGVIDQTLKDARLFKVAGRSAEPIALEGQYLITRGKLIKADAIASLDGRLVVGIDENGTSYFKRLRCHNTLVVLESLNPDGLTAAEILSLDNSHALPKITGALEVIGVLFELPNAKKAIPSS